MPMDRKKYPRNWSRISLAIRRRARGRCEWCGAENHKPHPKTGSIVILTVAHLGTPYPNGAPSSKDDKHDVRAENLAALCQRCHLNYDRADHIANRARNRRRKALEAGQLEFFPKPKVR